MEPIISPWLFYAVSVCDALHNAGGIMLGVAAFLAIGCLIGYINVVTDVDVKSIDQAERNLSSIKPFAVATLFFGVFGFIAVVFAPPKDIAMQMLAASIVTPDNVAAVQGNIVDFIGEVAKAIAAAKN